MGERVDFSPRPSKIVSPNAPSPQDQMVGLLQQHEQRLDALTAFVRRHDGGIYGAITMLEFTISYLVKMGIIDEQDFQKERDAYVEEQNKLRLKMIEEARNKPELFVPKNMGSG